MSIVQNMSMWESNLKISNFDQLNLISMNLFNCLNITRQHRSTVDAHEFKYVVFPVIIRT